MFDNTQFRQQIIQPTLQAMNLYSQAAEDLLIGTMAHESRGGTYLVQQGGPALGIYQMEPEDHDDIWKNYLPNQPKLTNDMMIWCKFQMKPVSSYLLYHLYYSTCMARIHYFRMPDAIPADLPGQAAYWKQYWNTPQGAGTVDEYINDYNVFVGNNVVTSSKAKKNQASQ